MPSKAIKIISFKRQQDQVNPLYQITKILKLDGYISLMNCLLAFDQTNNNLPLSFHNFFKHQNDTHDYCTRGSTQGHLVPPQIKTTTWFKLNQIKICLNLEPTKGETKTQCQ